MPEALELSPRELQSRLQAGDRLVIIDIREPEEAAISRLENALLIPMQSVPAELQKLEALSDEADLIRFVPSRSPQPERGCLAAPARD